MNQNVRSIADPTETKPVINTEFVRSLMIYGKFRAGDIGRRCRPVLDEATVRKAINNLEPVSTETKLAVLRALSRALGRPVEVLCVSRLAA